MEDDILKDCLAKWSNIVQSNKKILKQEGSFFCPRAPEDTTPTEQRIQEWKIVLQGANDFSHDRDQYLNMSKQNEAKKEEKDGFGPLVRGDKQITKGDTTYETNPITFSSIGPDAAPYDGPNRVSKMSDSDKLDELSKLKTQVEVMERRVHRADTMKKKNFNGLSKKLVNLREKVNKLSEEIQSKPDTDVT